MRTSRNLQGRRGIHCSAALGPRSGTILYYGPDVMLEKKIQGTHTHSPTLLKPLVRSILAGCH